MWTKVGTKDTRELEDVPPPSRDSPPTHTIASLGGRGDTVLPGWALEQLFLLQRPSLLGPPPLGMGCWGDDWGRDGGQGVSLAPGGTRTSLVHPQRGSVGRELLPISFLGAVGRRDLGRVGGSATIGTCRGGWGQRQEGERLQANEVGEREGIGGAQQSRGGGRDSRQRCAGARSEWLREAHTEIHGARAEWHLGGRFGRL